jgi:hypothetical protein
MPFAVTLSLDANASRAVKRIWMAVDRIELVEFPPAIVLESRRLPSAP